MKKRLLSILLTICMIVSLAPSVLAVEADLTISTAADLKAFADAVNNGNTYEGKTVVLAASIDLTGEWTPIGNGTRSGNSYTGNAFKGSFDGGNYTVSGLTITTNPQNADAALGLFGVVDGGTVKNLKLTNVNINVSSSELAGGAIGILTGDGTADSIEVSGSVSALRGNGGIVGRMLVSGTIRNCVNHAAISGTGANVGGIVGAAYYTATGKTMIISGCTNNGVISSSSSGVGGIAGLSAANVSNCTNTAAVTGGGFSIGGIVGEQQNYGSIVGCTNSANVSVASGTGSGNYGTGGIVGWIRYNGSDANYPLKGVVEVKDNTNSGSVSGASDAGGIIGTVYHAAEVSGNTNTAERLTATNFAAGLVANFQFSDTYWGDPIPEQELNLQNNISTTTLDNISANSKGLYVYDNSNGTQDGEIEDNSKAWVAQIGTVKYATLQAAIDAANSGETVTVLADVELTEGLLVAADDKIILDLNGKTVSYETTESKADDMLINKGDLTISDSSESKTGKLSYKYSGAANTSYSYDNATIQNEGTLTILAGTVENTTAAMSHASYAINTNAGATLNVKGGKVLNLNGHAIRQVSFGTAPNTVNISGGYIEGTRAVQVQLPGSASATTAPEMALNISGGELKSNESTYNLAVYVYSNGQSAANASVSISGNAILNGNVALNGSATGSMAEGAASVTGGTLNGDYGIFSYADNDTNNAITITGGSFATDYSQMYAEDDGYTFESYVDEEGNTVYGVEPTYIVTITILPADATIVVKDSEGNEVAAEEDGTYKLIDGTYSYTVSKPAYDTKTASFTVNGAPQSISVNLDKTICYTVIYIDGVEDAEIFAEQRFIVEAGAATPAFIGIPTRTGYTFTGWTPEFSATVTDNVTYIATWSYNFFDIVPTTTYAVSVENSIGGKVVANTGFATVGSTINLTVTPDTGYELDTLIVKANSLEITTVVINGTYNFIMPDSNVTVTATFKKIETPTVPTFVDVNKDAYYYDAVQWAVENGITLGITETTFVPDMTCTRAQIVTFLWRAQQSPANNTANPFADIATDAYYTKAVQWAVENGITQGTSDTTFSPNNDCTRAQIVTFLYRCMGDK